MKSSTRNIVFSLLLTLGFLAPLSVNFIHSFTKHVHFTCNVKTKTHVHKIIKDCSNLHYIIPPFTVLVTIFNSTCFNIKNCEITENIFFYFLQNPNLKSSRAPPFL